MSHHEALPSRFKRSRSPSRELPPQNTGPAQNAKVVIELSDSEDETTINTRDMSVEVGTAQAPPQGPASLGVRMNIEMENMFMEAGKTHAPPKGPAGRKKKPQFGCANCHSDFHTHINCPHRAANLNKKDRKAAQLANRRANRAAQFASGAMQGTSKARLAATSLGVKNLQLRKGAKADIHLHRKKPAGPSGAAKRKASRHNAAANRPIAHTAPAYPYSSHQAQIYPGPQPGSAGPSLSQPQPAPNPPIVQTAPTNPSSAYQDPTHPYRQQLIHSAASAQPDKFSRLKTEQDKSMQQELIPGLNIVNATAKTYPPSTCRDQVHPDRQPFVAPQPDEFTRLKTERDKIAQLQELVPSISFVNARNALLMHRWDLSLAFEMAGIIEDNKAGAGKAGYGVKCSVQEWEAEHLDDQRPKEVEKPSFSGAGVLPKTAYEPVGRNVMGMSKAEYPGQAGDMKPVEFSASLLGKYQYSGGQGEDIRFISTAGHVDRGNEWGPITLKTTEGGHGTQDMLAYTPSPYPVDTGFPGGTGPPPLAEHSHGQAADTSGAESIDSILRRLMHK